MGTTELLEADTKTELRKQAQSWARQVRGVGLEVVLGYDPDRIQQREDGKYVILMRAHT